MITPPDAEALVPPRPNLGPEPWPESSGHPSASIAWAIGLGLVVALVAARWLRARRRRRSHSGPAGPSPAEADPSPTARLIAASDSVRSALIRAFGPNWASKTTEEVAADPGLADRVGPGSADALVAFLRLADRAKFAGHEPEEAAEWDAWASSFAAEIDQLKKT